MWFDAALQFAREPQTWAFVLNLVLIMVIDRRLLRMVQALERLSAQVVQYGTHNTSRMEEIRNAIYRMAGWDVPEPRTRSSRSVGGTHGPEGAIHRPDDR